MSPAPTWEWTRATVSDGRNSRRAPIDWSTDTDRWSGLAQVQRPEVEGPLTDAPLVGVLHGRRSSRSLDDGAAPVAPSPADRLRDEERRYQEQADEDEAASTADPRRQEQHRADERHGDREPDLGAVPRVSGQGDGQATEDRQHAERDRGQEAACPWGPWRSWWGRRPPGPARCGSGRPRRRGGSNDVGGPTAGSGSTVGVTVRANAGAGLVSVDRNMSQSPKPTISQGNAQPGCWSAERCRRGRRSRR